MNTTKTCATCPKRAKHLRDGQWMCWGCIRAGLRPKPDRDADMRCECGHRVTAHRNDPPHECAAERCKCLAYKRAMISPIASGQ